MGRGLRLFLIAFIAYNANLAYLGSADTLPGVLIPAAVVNHGDVFLERYGLRIRGTPPDHEPYSVQARGSHIVSNYPIAPSLLATPLYLVPCAIARAAGLAADSPRFLSLCKALGKLAASLATALAAACVLRILDRWQARGATLLALAFAFGTTALSIASQAMWQHATAMLLLALTILLLESAPSSRRALLAAGVAAGLAIASRPTTLTLVLAIAAYVVHRHKREAVRFAAPALAIVLVQLAYNVHQYGDPRGGYAMILAQTRGRQGVEGGFDLEASWIAFLGLLFSPSRGLLVFSPYVVFAAAGAVLVWRQPSSDVPRGLLLRYLSIGVVAQLLQFSAYRTWWGGMGYGPRYLSEAYVPLVLLLAPVYPRLARTRPPGGSAAAATVHGLLGRRMFHALVVVSCAIFAIGAFGNPHDWYARYRVDRNHAALWSISKGEIVHALKARSEFGNLIRSFQRAWQGSPDDARP